MARADFSANPDILPRYNSIKMSGPLCYLYTAYLGKVWAVVRGFLRVHSHLPREGRWNVLNCFKLKDEIKLNKNTNIFFI